MDIEVIILATGKIARIAKDDFDKELHVKVERDNPDDGDKPKIRTVGEMSPEDFAKGIGTAISDTLRDTLKELTGGKPDGEEGGKGKQKKRIVVKGGAHNADEPVNRYDDKTVAYARAARCVPGWEAQYVQLPEMERAIRTPEGDVYTWRFMNAFAEKDAALLNELKAHDLKRFGDLDMNDPFIRATMGTTSTAVGGALVPSPLANLIVLKRDAKERLFPRSMQLTTEAETLSVPSEATVGAVAGTAENAAIGETDSTLAETVLTKKKVARLARSSKELMSSISGAFSLSTILSNQAGRKFAVYFDLQGAEDGDGVGTNHTLSITEAALTTVTASGALTRTILTDLILGLPTEWRDGTSLTLMGNSVITGFITNLEDTTGRPLYAGVNEPTRPMSDVGNATNIVEGVPYIELPFPLDKIYIGVLNECFAVLSGGGMRVEMTDVGAGAFASDQLVWKFVERRDSAVTLVDGFRETSGAITAPA